MGAGKTTVGRGLAKELKYRFVDADHELERRMGVPIPTIFEIEGEAGFRQREKQLITELTQLESIVLATGGGAIMDADNRHCLNENGTVIYLCAQPEILHDRTRHDRSRPLLQVEDRLAVLQALYEQRDPLYREAAHLVIDIKQGPVSQIIRRILSRLSGNA